jgi:hypothetical protein
MEDRKFCPLCYCLADTALSPGTLMCEKEKCMWWQDGDCICNTAVRALIIISNTTKYPRSSI